MKDISEMSEAELREALKQLLAKGAVRSSRRELMERDPKAYFTRREDFERAEKLRQDVDWVPRLNSCG